MRTLSAAAGGAVVLVLCACGGGAVPAAPADAARVGLTVSGDGAVGADTPLACALRVVPAESAPPAGAVSDCTNLHDAQPDLALSLASGRYVLQAVRAACPGMPGECPEDPYAELYSGTLGGVEWSCEVPVMLAPRQAVTVAVELTADAHGGGHLIRCTAG